ncbi:hypothetical protein ONZ45_g7398 [Pleurotus djamor]|nr:hypothetical protein ONZ45_g7398 [Pleurotus djamor]
MFVSALITLACSASAFASVFITSPTASTTFSGGKVASITWQDDGKAPSLKDWGFTRVSVYAGNAQQQTSLQLIVDNVDVSTTSSIQFTPNPQIGPNSAEYFIRFESVNLKDPAQPQYPMLAFSSKFRMDEMTGKFSPAVEAQINGQSTAPLAGSPTGTVSKPSVNPATTTPAAKPTSSSVSGSGTAAAASQADGAIAIGSSAKILAGVVAAVAVMLC